MKNPASASLLACAALLLGGCVTHITTDITQNPAPTEKFANFRHVEMSQVALVEPYAGQESNRKALAKIQENVSQAMEPLLKAWNAPGPAGDGPMLQIDPRITEIKFIDGAARFWAGSFAGSSAVVLEARITEKGTGRVIATPQFYARASAMGGAFTIGGTDNAMLTRIANRLTAYLAANYDQAVGGPSGQEAPSKK